MVVKKNSAQRSAPVQAPAQVFVPPHQDKRKIYAIFAITVFAILTITLLMFFSDSFVGQAISQSALTTMPDGKAGFLIPDDSFVEFGEEASILTFAANINDADGDLHAGIENANFVHVRLTYDPNVLVVGFNGDSAGTHVPLNIVSQTVDPNLGTIEFKAVLGNNQNVGVMNFLYDAQDGYAEPGASDVFALFDLAVSVVDGADTDQGRIDIVTFSLYGVDLPDGVDPEDAAIAHVNQITFDDVDFSPSNNNFCVGDGCEADPLGPGDACQRGQCAEDLLCLNNTHGNQACVVLINPPGVCGDDSHCPETSRCHDRVCLYDRGAICNPAARLGDYDQYCSPGFSCNLQCGTGLPMNGGIGFCCGEEVYSCVGDKPVNAIICSGHTGKPQDFNWGYYQSCVDDDVVDCHYTCPVDAPVYSVADNTCSPLADNSCNHHDDCQGDLVCADDGVCDEEGLVDGEMCLPLGDYDDDNFVTLDPDQFYLLRTIDAQADDACGTGANPCDYFGAMKHCDNGLFSSLGDADYEGFSCEQ